MQRMEAGPYYNKLFVAGLGGRAPEIFVSHVHALSRLTRAGFVRSVDDFGDFVGGGGGIDFSDIDPNVFSAVASGSDAPSSVPLPSTSAKAAIASEPARVPV